MKKGLRPAPPDGVKTDQRNTDRPDEEGIKTDLSNHLIFRRETQTDLMKKGLRLCSGGLQGAVQRNTDRPDEEGIKTATIK